MDDLTGEFEFEKLKLQTKQEVFKLLLSIYESHPPSNEIYCDAVLDAFKDYLHLIHQGTRFEDDEDSKAFLTTKLISDISYMLVDTLPTAKARGFYTARNADLRA